MWWFAPCSIHCAGNATTVRRLVWCGNVDVVTIVLGKCMIIVTITAYCNVLCSPDNSEAVMPRTARRLFVDAVGLNAVSAMANICFVGITSRPFECLLTTAHSTITRFRSNRNALREARMPITLTLHVHLLSLKVPV